MFQFEKVAPAWVLIGASGRKFGESKRDYRLGRTDTISKQLAVVDGVGIQTLVTGTAIV